MNRLHRIALAGALASLAACGNAPAPPAPPVPPAPPAADAPKTFIGRQVDKAMNQARKELATENISISDGFDISVNGRKVHKGDNTGLPKAEITPQGDLLVEGKTVRITPEQRRQLLAYRAGIIGVAEAGMAIGSKGAELAGEALGGVVGVIFGGEEGGKAFEQRMEAEGRKIEAEAMKLCRQLPSLLASQQALAASLPEFKPYARMTQDDIDDCGKDAEGTGVAVTDADRDRIREEIREEIRQEIREGIRGTAQAAAGDANDDAASTPAR